MSKSIRLSDKHGVNPAIPKCFICGESKNEILLFGKLKGDAEAPHGMVLDKVPCDKCEEYMEMGIILISTRDGEEGDNPYRTGGWAVLKEEAVVRMINDPEVLEGIVKKRMAFVPDEVWDAIGIPRA